MSLGERGFTMIELLMATVILTVAIAGIMAARVTVSQIMRNQRNVSFAEASGYAQQTAERFRNDIACDSGWFDANCDVDPAALPGWTADPLPAGGSESIMTIDPTAKRCYRVVPAPAGSCGTESCLQMDVRVCWHETPCPC